jgi:hypothetical protein
MPGNESKRLVDKIWLGGDWSLVEFKKFWSSLASTQDFYHYICVEPAPGQTGRRKERATANVSTLIPLMQEVAHPSKMRRVPFVQFWYETLLGLVFIFLAIDRIIRGADDRVT